MSIKKFIQEKFSSCSKEELSQLIFCMSQGEIEDFVDAGIRHSNDSSAEEYVESWKNTASLIVKSITGDDDLATFEKQFPIIIRRLVMAENRVNDLEDVIYEMSKDQDTKIHLENKFENREDFYHSILINSKLRRDEVSHRKGKKF